MPLLKIREKIDKIRCFFSLFKYSKEKRLYISIFIVMLIITLVFTAVYINQKNIIRKRENILRSYIDNGAQGNDSKISEKTVMIKAHICGCVENPGIYSLEDGARIADLLEKAGGIKDEACIEAINLAEFIRDGQKIYVPSILEIEDNVLNDTFQNSQNINTITGNTALVNINLASIDDLQELPGIGPVIAGRIVEYRDNHGSFKSKDELILVSGIGIKKYEGIEDLITV